MASLRSYIMKVFEEIIRRMYETLKLSYVLHNNKQAIENCFYLLGYLVFCTSFYFKILYHKNQLRTFIVLLAIANTNVKLLSQKSTFVDREKTFVSKHTVLKKSSYIVSKVDIQWILNSMLYQNDDFVGNDTNPSNWEHIDKKCLFKKKAPDKTGEKISNFRELVSTASLRTIHFEPVVIHVAPVFRQDVVNKCSRREYIPIEERMKHEMFRFCSFQHYPLDNKPFSIRFAQAGYYYARNGDEVICYCCNHRKGNWSSKDDPMQVHKTMSPCCQFLTHNIEVNISIQPREDVNDNKECHGFFDSDSANGTASHGIMSQNADKRLLASTRNNWSLQTRNNDPSAQAGACGGFEYHSSPITIKKKRNAECSPIIKQTESNRWSTETVAASSSSALNSPTENLLIPVDNGPVTGNHLSQNQSPEL